jgi:Domain of unknown function (DUF4105)
MSARLHQTDMRRFFMTFKLFWKGFFVLGCVFLGTNLSQAENTYLQSLIHEAHQKNLSHDPIWLGLLHYHPVYFGSMKSDIDGDNFFLSKNGRHEPEAELNATLTSFFDPVSSDTDTQHPQCAYPARYAWLKDQLHFTSNLPEHPCPRFEAWENNIRPESVSIVFASYYMNNPASMYGHTFLQLGRKGQLKGERLLDYTVNFAALTNTVSGLDFAIRGLAGGYRGGFSTTPYYMKVQKYNNLESRDLWEYELNVSSAGVDRLARHLWELGNTTIAYYFLNKNCSYQLLPLLEVAEPSRNLSSRFRFRAIPLDTLRSVLSEPEFAVERRYRPSYLQLMIWRNSKLNKAESKLASDFVTKPEAPVETMLMNYAPDRQVLILDSAYDYLRYKTGFQREKTEVVQQLERRILLARNKIPLDAVKEPPWIPDPEPPEAAHPTARVAAWFGATKDSSFEEFSIRPAFHDLENDPTGFTPGSELEMFSLRVRYENQHGKAHLEELTAINIKSLSPWEGWIHKPSWKFKFGFDTAHDLDRSPESALYFGGHGGSGLTFSSHKLNDAMLYAMIEVDAGIGGIFRDDYRVGAGPSIGILLSPIRKYRIHFNGSVFRYGLGNISTVNNLKLVQAVDITHTQELRLTLSRQNAYSEIMGSFNLYY